MYGAGWDEAGAGGDCAAGLWSVGTLLDTLGMPKSHRDGGRQHVGTFFSPQALPLPAQSIPGSVDGVAGKGMGGRGGGKGLLPSAALAACLDLCTPAHGSWECHDGPHWQPWKRDHKSKPELSHPLRTSAPSHPGAGVGHGSTQLLLEGMRGAGSRTSTGLFPGHQTSSPIAGCGMWAASRDAPPPCLALGCCCWTPTTTPSPSSPGKGGAHGMKEPARTGEETWQRDDGAALDAFPPGRRNLQAFSYRTTEQMNPQITIIKERRKNQRKPFREEEFLFH